jgi:hypothetical protein
MAHAQRRYVERFGVAASRALISDFIKKIQDGDAEFVRRRSHRVTIWDIAQEGKIVRAAYDKQRKMIVTFMRVGK